VANGVAKVAISAGPAINSANALILPRRDQRLIRLHVDHIVGADTPVGLSETIRATGVIAPRHQRFEARRGHAIAQKFMVHREVEGHFRRLARDALRDPKQQGLALDLVQELAREAGGTRGGRER